MTKLVKIKELRGGQQVPLRIVGATIHILAVTGGTPILVLPDRNLRLPLPQSTKFSPRNPSADWYIEAPEGVDLFNIEVLITDDEFEDGRIGITGRSLAVTPVAGFVRELWTSLTPLQVPPNSSRKICDVAERTSIVVANNGANELYLGSDDALRRTALVLPPSASANYEVGSELYAFNSSLSETVEVFASEFYNA